jgi:pyrroline-5-carboxylate reductase
MNLAEFFPSLGFVGAGNMAGAILRGVVGEGKLNPKSCAAYDVIAEKAEALADELGIAAAVDLAELMNRSTSVVLATKPQDLPPVLEELNPITRAEHRMISICAGVRCSKIEAALPEGTRVVRVMPNTPALVGEGAAGVAGGARATEEDVAAVRELFEAVGVAVVVPEESLDAVTALSGSGPAYVFRLMELMEQAGVAMGLPADLARKLTLQTVLGSAKLASDSDDSPADLRKKVTSKGGTTAAALSVFDDRGLEAIVLDALTKARDRSIELST